MRYIHSIVSSFTVAATSVSSVELPERCKLPSAQGPCRAAMPRWYFNKDTKNCEQFTFGGCLPNENNFFTETECENACEAYIPHQELDDLSNKIQAKSAPVEDIESDGCSDKAFVTGRCRAMLNRWSWNPESLSCEKFVFGGCDGNGNNFPSKKKCEKKCSYLASQRVMQFDAIENEEEEQEEQEEVVEEVDPCSEPRQTGRCRARFDRFYFNSKTGDCEAFTYGGCEGNGNNFQTIQLCRQKCLKSNGNMQNDAVEIEEEEEEEEVENEKGNKNNTPETDACSLKADPGFCRGYFKVWYFDGEECKTFVYGGCQGNANRFQSKEECENVCKSDEPIFGRVLEVDNQDEKPICEQPIFTGPCRAMYPKFGFDGENCVPFMFGGCMGNQNNFGSESQCRQTCMMQNDASTGNEEEEEEEEADNTNGQSLIMSREAICKKSGSGNLGGTRYNSKLSCTKLKTPPKTSKYVDYLDLSKLNGNPNVKHLAKYLSKFPNLKILFLDDNKFIKTLPVGIFNGMKKLKVISLKGSAIKSLPNKLFSMNPVLKCLILKDSSVTDIGIGVFSSNIKRKLKEVDLRGSKVRTSLERHFKGKKRISQFLSLL